MKTLKEAVIKSSVKKITKNIIKKTTRTMDQGAITYKDLFLSVPEAVYVRYISITQYPGEHGTLYAEAVLDSDMDENEFHGIFQDVVLVYAKEKESKILFKGIIDRISMKKEGAERVLCLEAWDSTRKMDMVRRSRAFQNPQMTVKQLVDEVMTTYQNSDYMINVPNVPIGQLVVQYEETDWEFLKRFLSKYNAAIYPDTSFSAIRFQAGVNPDTESYKWDNLPYVINQDFNWLKSMKQNGYGNLTTGQSVGYHLETYDIAIMGNQITYKGNPWYIGAVERKLKEGILVNEYFLKQKEGLMVMPYFNQRITGISIDGLVSAVNRDKIQVIMAIDAGGGSSNNYWFPFSTVASSSDGSGWYCMPEQGESIRIYFPVDDEKEAYAITNIKAHKPEEGNTADPMGNPNVRSIASEQGNQVKFTETGVVISSTDQGSILLNKDGTIVFDAIEDISIGAAESIQIVAENEIKITAQTSIKMMSDGGADIQMSSGKIELHGMLIHEN